MSPSADSEGVPPKGFLIVGARVAPSSVQFKNFRRQLGRFIVRADQHVELPFDRGETDPHLCVLTGCLRAWPI